MKQTIKCIFKRVVPTGVAIALIATLVGCGQSQPLVAKVDDKAITQAQFQSFLKYKRIDDSNTQAVSAQLNQYVDREALALAIEKSQLLDQNNIDAELNEFKKQMLISRYFETFLKQQVSDSAVRNYYASHSEQFESKKVKVAHILIRTHANIDETERQAKYTRAHEAYSQIKSGTDFAQVVKDFSQDSISAKKDGVIGWLNEGAIDPVFSQKVFNELKKDQVSEPFQSSFGFHIVKVLEGPAVVKKPLEKVMGDIRHQLRKEAKAAELKRLTATVNIDKQS